MKILTGKQIREADLATIEREAVSSLALMERASEEIAKWIGENIQPEHRLIFCCGRGNNGGDGLAVARMLHNADFECVVFFAVDYNEITDDSRTNIKRLPEGVNVYDITCEQPEIEPDAVIIDALFGSGITDEARDPVRSAINWMNTLANRIISIDMPSGISTEWNNAGRTIVDAETTLTLEFPKLSLLLPEAGERAGNIVVLPIGLDEKFIEETPSPYYYVTDEMLERLRKPRLKHAHKGTYGHALLICGSRPMMGAAILATGGALRSGCGLVTAHIPEKERFAMQANWASAMLSFDNADHFSEVPDNLERFAAIGVGCGLGQNEKTVKALGELLAKAHAKDIPLLLDADALNIIADNPEFRKFITAGSILTPHPGELRRIVGEWSEDREKLDKASALAHELASIVIIKGANTVICTTDGRFLFNSTGNAGMAKGGSGDVLAGYMTGVMARGYSAEEAALIGVYLHGKAGDKAAEYYGQEAMNSSDLTEFFE